MAANDFGTLAIARMLIAQAQIESFALVSADVRFSEYEVELLPLD